MEMVSIPLGEYERMKVQLSSLKDNLENIKEETKTISNLALLSEDSFAGTWLNEKEDEVWKDL